VEGRGATSARRNNEGTGAEGDGGSGR
jgi:hypothetical protein